MALTIKMR